MGEATRSRDEQSYGDETEEEMMGSTPRWRMHGIIIGVVCTLAMFAASWSTAAPPAVDAAFRKFWKARNVREASEAANEVVFSGVTFDEAMRRLKVGRTYSPNVPRGIVRLSRRTPNGQFFYDLNVPKNYNPRRRYQVRVQLHGGVMLRDTSRRFGSGSIGQLAGAEQIYVMPYAWANEPWWSDTQLENLREVLDSVKRTYNVDENRVVLAGVSDGATATYYFAMRDTTPFASFLSLNGFVLVLNSPEIQAGPVLFQNNLRSKPWFIVNGSADPQYPAKMVERYITHMKKAGVTIEYRMQPGAGHDTSWWPQVKGGFEAFVRTRPRVPHPERVVWENGGTELGNRAHWVLIDSVLPLEEGEQPPDLNPLAPDLFTHGEPFAHIEAVRKDNTVEVTVDRAAQFTLLLSPDVFDFERPVKIVVNDTVIIDQLLEKTLSTLMKYAALDNDRTMLYGGEFHIKSEE